MNYQRFSRSKWQEVEDASLSDFSKWLGNRPSHRSVGKSMANNHKLDILNQLAIIMLLVVALFTSFKLALAAIPLSDAIILSNLHTEGVIPSWLLHLYRFSIITSAVLVGTIGLIYWKLVAESSATRTKIDASKHLSKVNIQWWSPRLPQLLVYLSIVIIVLVSNVANVTVFDWFFSNTLVIVELALSYPVGIWMSKRQARSTAIALEVDKQRNIYDHRMKHYETDSDYLRILFQNASEALYKLKGKGRSTPNAELREADSKVVEQIIAQEYKRLRGGVGFSRVISGWLDDVPAPVDAPHAIIHTISNRISENNTSSVAESGTPSVRRSAPSGKWTADALEADLIASNAPRPLTEAYITQNYEAGQDARKVWRNSVNARWND